jgi:hypothetical protein
MAKALEAPPPLEALELFPITMPDAPPPCEVLELFPITMLDVPVCAAFPIEIESDTKVP